MASVGGRCVAGTPLRFRLSLVACFTVFLLYWSTGSWRGSSRRSVAVRARALCEAREAVMSADRGSGSEKISIVPGVARPRVLFTLSECLAQLPAELHRSPPGRVVHPSPRCLRTGNMMESQLLAMGAARGRTMIDVGVFDGTDYTIPAAADGMTVWSFEPVRRTFTRFLSKLYRRGIPVSVLHPLPGDPLPQPQPRDFEKRLAVWHEWRDLDPGRVIAVQAAVSDTSGVAEILMNRGPMNSLSVLNPNSSKPRLFENVTLVRLDDVSVSGSSVFLLKVDAQGGNSGMIATWRLPNLSSHDAGQDGRVLDGARNLLERCAFVAVEFWPKALDAARSPPLAVLDLLSNAGFVIIESDGTYARKLLEPLPFESYVARVRKWDTRRVIGAWSELLAIKQSLLIDGSLERWEGEVPSSLPE